MDYQPPGGQNVRARPFLAGHNFRADAVQVAVRDTQVASESAQGLHGATAMNDSYGTTLLPALLRHDPRIHPLDDTWY